MTHLMARKGFYQSIARELSTVARYMDRVCHWNSGERDESGRPESVFGLIEAPAKEVTAGLRDFAATDDRVLVLLNGTLNHSLDVTGLLTEVHQKLNRFSRVGLVLYSPYWKWFFPQNNRLTFFTEASLRSIAKLNGFEVVRTRNVFAFPFVSGFAALLLNRLVRLVPLLNRLAPAQVVFLRPIKNLAHQPSLSIVIPARNESGNIAACLQRLSKLRDRFAVASLEIIFIEGHSADDTWEVIQVEAARFRSSPEGDRTRITTLQQTGKGKGNAVREAFAVASGDALTIFDADLSTPAEALPEFLDAYVRGVGDFINGNRLVYPMQGKAMRFLNWVGNMFFAKLLSLVLETGLGDTLCGTKLFARRDYQRFTKWREDFGDFDPFGDFEILFPAAVLGLGIVDLPVVYHERVYGVTNIQRFRHGAMLLKMSVVGLFRVRWA